MAIPNFGKIEMISGSAISWPFSFTNDDDGSLRDVSADTVLFRAKNDDGTLLFPEKTATNGSTTDSKLVAFTTSDTAVTGSYYAELERRSGSTREIKAGTLLIAGQTI